MLRILSFEILEWFVIRWAVSASLCGYLQRYLYYLKVIANYYELNFHGQKVSLYQNPKPQNQEVLFRLLSNIYTSNVFTKVKSYCTYAGSRISSWTHEEDFFLSPRISCFYTKGNDKV